MLATEFWASLATEFWASTVQVFLLNLLRAWKKKFLCGERWGQLGWQRGDRLRVQLFLGDLVFSFSKTGSAPLELAHLARTV